MIKKTLLITGIHGFLGNRIKEILNDRYSLLGLSSQKSTIGEVPVYGSDDLEEIPLQPDFIIMCHAAVASGNKILKNKQLFNVNVDVTERILKKFKHSKIIYISTASIYNPDVTLISETSPDLPSNSYAMSKYWAEILVKNIDRSVIVRLSSLYGISMKENTIIPTYVSQALASNKIEVWGEGKRKQNYIFVDDTCLLIEKCILNFEKVVNKTLLAVHNREYSNLELAQIIAGKTNAVIKYTNTDFSKSLLYNNIITQSLINWHPKANLQEEVGNYIEWKKKQF
ncbi:NAD-dependent epimerase/dehydratase family protein [Leeuwenhoekiella sp. LLG6367-2.1]|uniref:NAD-dependent epimerase/dehydratase family protein n=1 Tax=Leeuwenhoekiella sp. LLG6367-2.1 TaxID=3160833 RepID=UPI00386C4870